MLINKYYIQNNFEEIKFKITKYTPYIIIRIITYFIYIILNLCSVNKLKVSKYIIINILLEKYYYL